MLNQDTVMMILAGLILGGALFGALAKGHAIARGTFVPRGRGIIRKGREPLDPSQ